MALLAGVLMATSGLVSPGAVPVLPVASGPVAALAVPRGGQPVGVGEATIIALPVATGLPGYDDITTAASANVPGTAPAAPAPAAPPAASSPDGAPAASAAPLTAPASATPAPGPADSSAASPASDAQPVRDPWEHTNRSIFAFDMSVDHHLVGPVAHGYTAVMPGVIRHHIGLVIANLDEPITTINELFQLHPGRFAKSLARLTLNTTIGLGGIFDFASHHKLPRHTADFGQTLGRWGVKPGHFVMLPLLGPANMRDGFGRAVDLVADPVSWLLGGLLTTFGASREGGEVVDGRARAEPALRAIYDSTDPYAATRSGYMQARAAVVRDATGKAEVLPEFDTP